MTRVHRWFGIALLVVFALTGQYMLRAHVAEMTAGPRLLYRSRHIYILFAALLHLTLGTFLVRRMDRRARTLQTIASALLVIGSSLLIAAFFDDPRHIDGVPLHLALSGGGIRAVAVGTLLHAIAGALPEAKHVSTVAQT